MVFSALKQIWKNSEATCLLKSCVNLKIEPINIKAHDEFSFQNIAGIVDLIPDCILTVLVFIPLSYWNIKMKLMS